MQDRLFEYLDTLNSKIDQMAADMATKDDLKGFATKDDLKDFATKDDLKGFATKDDLNFLFEIMKNGFNDVYDRFDSVEERLTSVELIVEDTRSDLRAFNEAIQGNTRRIDRLEDRVDGLETRAS